MPIDTATYSDSSSPTSGLEQKKSTRNEQRGVGLSENESALQVQSPHTPRTNFSESEFALLRDYQDRNDALSSITQYTRYMKRSGLPYFDFDPAPFHVPIIAALEALERGDIQRLMITMPPGHGKSHWANIIFPQLDCC